MTVLPALVLATLAATGCPALCPADELPEAPEPSVSPAQTPNASTVDELAPEAPLSTRQLDRSLLAELAASQLPTDDGPLTPDRTPEPAASPDAKPSPVEDDPSEAEASPGENHVVREDAEPRAAGEATHAGRAWPTTNGERVGQPGAALAASLALGLAAIGLYHKLSKDRALEHPARQRILRMLEGEPDLGTTDVADRLDVCYRTARHHLEVLARFDLVVQAKRQGSWRWARPGDAEALRELEVPELQQRMLSLLEEDPGLHLSEIARRLDAAKATVKHHLDRLADRGEVDDERRGPLRCFFPDR